MMTDAPQPVAAASAFMQAAQPAVTAPGPVVLPANPAAWGKVHTLRFPVTVDGDLLQEVSMRAITTGELSRLVMDDDREASVSLRARAMACGIHHDVFSALSAVDGAAIAEKLRPFLPAGLVAAEDELAEDSTAALF